MQESSGVLTERNMDYLSFFSPDKISNNSETPKDPDARISGKKSSRSSEVLSDEVTAMASSCDNPCESLFSPHTVIGKKERSFLVASKNAVENPGNVETFGM